MASSGKTADMESAIMLAIKQMKACMASSGKMTSMEWFSRTRTVKNVQNTLIMGRFRMADHMASEYYNMKMGQSTRARLRTVKRMGLDFQGRH